MNKILGIDKVKILGMSIVFLISPIFNHLKAEEIPKSTKEWIEIARKIKEIDQTSNWKNLIVYLNDKEPIVKKIAIEKIGEIGNENAIAYLERNDACWYVRRELLTSKKKISIKKDYHKFIKQGLSKKQIANKLIKDNPKYTNMIVDLFLVEGEIDIIKEIGKNNWKIQTVLNKFDFSLQEMLVKSSLSKLPENNRIKSAINLLVNSESIYQSKGVILTLIESGNIVIPDLLKLLDDPKNIPTQNPPPWYPVHRVYDRILVVLKSIPDKRSIEKLEELSNNKVEYVSKMAKESLEWVRSGVPYPFKYEGSLLIPEDDIPPDWQDK